MKKRSALRLVSEQLPLGEVAQLRSGKTPTRTVDSYWGGVIPWYSAKDLKSFRLTNSEEHISDEAVRSGAPLGDVGDLLVLVRGMTLLKDVPVCLLEKRGSFNQDLKLIKPKAKVLGEYLGYVLAASKPRLMSMVTVAGHGTGRLEIDQLKQVLVWVPKEDVQRYLVEQLGAFEKVLQLQKQLMEAKREYKRGLAHVLLTGKKRFPEFRGTAWIETHLGDAFEERSDVGCSDLPLLSITNDRGIIPRHELEKRDTSNPDKSKYKRVAVGDIAYNTMRMWQGVSALSTLEGIVSPAYTVAVPTDRIDGAFAKHLFKFAPVVHKFHRYSQGLVDDTLNLKFDRFAKIRVRIPSDAKEQKMIAATLDLCDAELSLLTKKRKQFELCKRALLSRLLSGEISVVP